MIKPALLAATAIVAASGCGEGSAGPDGGASPSADTGAGAQAQPNETRSLYERLGGKRAITAVVDGFVARTTTDPRIKERFFNTNTTELKRQLVDLVCQTAGGPCKYSGRDMATAHSGMDLVGEEFDAVVECLTSALDQLRVPAREKKELLTAMASLRTQVVVSDERLHAIEEARLREVDALAGRLSQAAELLGTAVVAGKRGQRSYAEQLISRAELLIGAEPLAAAAATFRGGAPPRVTSALATMPGDTPPQPAGAVGSSEEDEPDRRPPRGRGSLRGVLRLDGQPVGGLGVVMLRPLRGRVEARTPKRRVIEQRQKAFAPHVMAVPVGSTVSFPNFDPIFHNVFSVSKARPFDLGMYRNGELREVEFERPGFIRLGCNIHPSMSAYLIVVADPHYAVVEEGSFEFRSLKPGPYRVEAWSERAGDPTVTRIKIARGDNQVAIDLAPPPAQAAARVDKFGDAR